MSKRPSPALAKIAGTVNVNDLGPSFNSTVIGAASVMLIWFVAAVQWPLNDMVVPWDSKNQFYAFYRFMADAINNGSSPFWNPYHYAGHPSIADPQSMIFSPVFVLWALVNPKPTLFAFDALVFAHLLVGGLALVAHGRRRGWPIAASILAAVIFMFGGPVSGRLNHVGIITAYALFPVALLWTEIALDRRSYSAALGLGTVTALIILGRSQVPLLLCLVLIILLICNLASRPAAGRFLQSRLGVLLVAGFTTLALISIPMLMTLQFAEFSNRPQVDQELALRSSLYPVNFATFFVPNVFGSLEPLNIGNWGPGYSTRPDVDSTDRAFNYLFVGSLPALLLVWHGFVGGRIFACGNRVFLSIAVFAALYAMGRYTPVFAFMFEYIPGIGLFRRPVGGTFIFVLSFAYLMGFLVTDYIRNGIPNLRPLAIAAAITAVAGLLVWAIIFSAISAKGWTAAFEIVKVAPIYIGLILILRSLSSPSMRTLIMGIAVAFTSGELIVCNVASPMNSEPRNNYLVLEAQTNETKLVKDLIEKDMIQHGDLGSRPRVEIIGLGGPWQNAAMIMRLEATNGYNPLRIWAYDRLVSPGETSYVRLQRSFPNSFPGYDCALGSMLGLQYIVTGQPIEQIKGPRRQTLSVELLSGPKIWIYRLANVAPRVVFDSQVLVADAEGYIDEGRFPETLRNGDVMVDVDDTLHQKYNLASVAIAKSSKTAITAWQPDRIEIVVDSNSSGILTLHDPWYPGWEVEVDQMPKEILRTNILFRGVEVPAGLHKVVFTYRPLSFKNLSTIVQQLFYEGE